jgi:hypothetical protein
MVRFTNAITNILLLIQNSKFKTPPKFDYKQNLNLLWERFVGMDLKCDTLDVVIFLESSCCVNPIRPLLH